MSFEMSQVANNIFTFFVLAVFFFIIYAKYKKQSIKEVFEGLKGGD